MDLALKNRHLSPAGSFGFEIGLKFRYNGGLRGGKWDIPDKLAYLKNRLQQVGKAQLTDASYFVLTEQGVTYAREILGGVPVLGVIGVRFTGSELEEGLGADLVTLGGGKRPGLVESQ